MKSWTIGACLLLGVGALIGVGTCASSTMDTMDEQRARAQNQHTESIRKAIQRKEIMVGMASDDVLASWGKPRKVDHTSTAKHEHENWLYPSGALVVFMDGKVRSITTSKP